MLTRPSACRGCPLDSISSGFMKPDTGTNGVLLLGEALGENEANEGRPFVGKAGFKLSRLLEWAGFDRKDFSIANAAWCRPPDNKLEGTSYELPAIAHCRTAHWGKLLASHRVIVPLGNVATNAMINRKGILSIRGYVWPGEGYHVIPTVHPSFLNRGMSKWSSPFINDIQKAVTLARVGMPPQVTNYLLDPSPMQAYQWAQRYREALRNDPSIRLAFDIETPGKPEDDDETDTDSDAPDRTWNIERISFAYRPLEAISFAWAPEYMAAVKMALEGPGELVVWNAGFDVPRLQRCGIRFGGLIHDGMIAWHILHSDLPKSLRFVATFTCPWQPAWKHLSGAKPALYSATDSCVETRSMTVIESELRKTGLWEVYERDVLELDPILVHMHDVGMPVDEEVRIDRAVKLATVQAEVYGRMAECVPIEARKIEKVFVKTPKDTTGLCVRPGSRIVPCCARCGYEKPGKPHFKCYKKKVNVCAGAGCTQRTCDIDEWYRLADFTPSRDQLTRYHQWLRRPLPTVWDKKAGRKKVSFGEEQLRTMIERYPTDTLYPAILEWRAISKLASTYIGYPVED